MTGKHGGYSSKTKIIKRPLQGNRKVQLKNFGLHPISLQRLAKRLKFAPRNVPVAG